MDIRHSAMLASLAALSHRNRMIQLQGPHDGLVVERFEGQEGVCGDHRLQIDCLSTYPSWISIPGWSSR